MNSFNLFVDQLATGTTRTAEQIYKELFLMEKSISYYKELILALTLSMQCLDISQFSASTLICQFQHIHSSVFMFLDTELLQGILKANGELQLAAYSNVDVYNFLQKYTLVSLEDKHVVRSDLVYKSVIDRIHCRISYCITLLYIIQTQTNYKSQYQAQIFDILLGLLFVAHCTSDRLDETIQFCQNVIYKLQNKYQYQIQFESLLSDIKDIDVTQYIQNDVIFQSKQHNYQQHDELI